MMVPGGAACYFCLGEGPDDEGKPLVRDCSCRGDSAGFAHLSCLTKYAEQKSRAAGDRNSFSDPWEICTNCKQSFQNQLSIDLASAFVSFAEANYGHAGKGNDKLRVLDSLRHKIVVLSTQCGTSNKQLRYNAETTIFTNEFLSIIDQTKKDFKMNGWIHMPHDSEKYEYYRWLCGNYEAFGYYALGAMAQCDKSKEGFKIAITHFKKARAIYNLVGLTDEAKQMENRIVVATELQASNDPRIIASSTVTISMLQNLKNKYEQNLNIEGMNSEDTLRPGMHYASMLWAIHHFIEAERLATKLVPIIRRVHGPDHKSTIEADELLAKLKRRYVSVLPDCKLFQALRYENDVEVCVVMGPVTVTEPRQVDDGKTYRVENRLLLPFAGCPVICHGLVSASHLNGELGEARTSTNTKTGFRLAVNFEKKSLKSVLIKPENLRIAFELPNEE